MSNKEFAVFDLLQQPHAAILTRSLALNNLHAIELSWLDNESFHRLLGISFYRRGIGADGTFLLAFDQDANYHSVNFCFFKQKYPRFIYVDRVVVAPNERNKGLAKLLYNDLFSCARAAGHLQIVCEVNLNPPNPASDAFHARLNFHEVGRAQTPDGKKTVRYLRHLL